MSATKTPRADNRNFQVWEYQVSHGQLLVRSPITPGTSERPAYETNADVVFVGVKYMSLPRSLHGLTLASATPEEVQQLELLLDKDIAPDSVTILVSGRSRFPVIAAGVSVSENAWDIFESPFEFRSRFRGGG